MKKTEKTEKFAYVEPSNYFPKKIRKACKIGEYATEEENKSKYEEKSKDKKEKK